MGWLDTAAKKADEFAESVRAASYKTTAPTQASQRDYDAWDNSAGSRQQPKNKEEIEKLLALTNPVRVMRIKSDKKWLAKQMKKMKLNPEDGRWLF